jgi:putative membrane protein
MDYNDGSWSAVDWVAMAAMMLVFWSLVIGLVVWIIRSVRGPEQSGDRTSVASKSADQVLAERFARGEIDEDEFRRRRALLSDSASHST